MREKKFTLIELIIVIVVIGLLSGMALPKFIGVKRDAKVAVLYREIDSLEKAIMVYQQNNDTLPIISNDTKSNKDNLFEKTLEDFGDSTNTIKKLDINKLKEYINKCRYGNGNEIDDYYYYSSKTNKVYYKKGLINSNKEYVFTLDGKQTINTDSEENNSKPEEVHKSNYLKILLNFIDNKLSNEFGVYTNYLRTPSNNPDITTGHSILSESQGLMMLYSVNGGDKARFEKYYNIVNNNMLLDTGLVAWRINEDGSSDTSINALIDDLRIVKSLLYAYDKWGDLKYKDLALSIGNALKTYCIGDDGKPRDFYDSVNHMTNQHINLCYLDINAMRLLAKYDPEWNIIIANSQKIIDNAYISDEVPFYYKEYFYDTKEYKDMKDESGNPFIDTTTSVITTLYQSESGKDVKPFLKWANNKLSTEGFIVGRYNYDGSAASNIESTAIYSVVALIAQQQNDIELMNKCLNKLKEFQLNDIGWNQADTSHELYGGFGDKGSLGVYSFDNLYALNAFLYLKE